MAGLFSRVRAATGRQSPVLAFVEFDEALRLARHGPAYSPDARPVPPRQESELTQWSPQDAGGSRLLQQMHHKLIKQRRQAAGPKRPKWKALTWPKARTEPLASERYSISQAIEDERVHEEESTAAASRREELGTRKNSKSGTSSSNLSLKVGRIKSKGNAAGPVCSLAKSCWTKSQKLDMLRKTEKRISFKEVTTIDGGLHSDGEVSPRDSTPHPSEQGRDSTSGKSFGRVKSGRFGDTRPSDRDSTSEQGRDSTSGKSFGKVKSGRFGDTRRNSKDSSSSTGACESQHFFVGSEGTREIVTEPWDWYKLQILHQAFNLPQEEIVKTRMLFDKYDRNKDGLLEATEFQLIVRNILRELYPSAKDVPRALIIEDGKLSFYDLLEWLSKHSFTEMFLLSPEQQRLRSIARKWGIKIVDVEHIKKEFDVYDVNGTGTIEYFEFKNLMLSLMKVPAHVEFPENRVKAFWNEVDHDNDGIIDFEEFLGWYRRNFPSGHAPHEQPKGSHNAVLQRC